jgi:hypothetical protein
MKKRNGMTRALAAGLAVAGLAGVGLAGAPVSAVSAATPLDTRARSAVADAENRGLDTRSFTEAWSAERALNTKKFVGTMILLR